MFLRTISCISGAVIIIIIARAAPSNGQTVEDKTGNPRSGFVQLSNGPMDDPLWSPARLNHEKRGLGILGDQEHVAHGVNRRRVNDNAVEVTKQLIENAAELYIIEELGRIRSSMTGGKKDEIVLGR